MDPDSASRTNGHTALVLQELSCAGHPAQSVLFVFISLFLFVGQWRGWRGPAL